jgi:4-aminobutyrate aminotransferase
MIAAEFCDPDSRQPDADAARLVQRLALEQGLLLLTCGMHGNVIRFLYPLTIPMLQFEAALAVIEGCLSELAASRLRAGNKGP